MASQADADSGEKQGKKFRGENGAGHVSGEAVIEPIRQLNGHTDAVMSVVWKDQSSVFSASMDYSVRKLTHTRSPVCVLVAHVPQLVLVEFEDPDRGVPLCTSRKGEHGTLPGFEQIISVSSLLRAS